MLGHMADVRFPNDCLVAGTRNQVDRQATLRQPTPAIPPRERVEQWEAAAEKHDVTRVRGGLVAGERPRVAIGSESIFVHAARVD
jgi:hypothetical protein